MKAMVVYASRSGNTRRVAEAIAEGIRPIGRVEVSSVDDPQPSIGDQFDLVVVGGPTEGRHMTPAMLEFLERLPRDSVRGVLAAAFDTRVDWPRFLSGSAANDIRRHLERLGARAPVPTESFLVSLKPEIRPDELERARVWGATLAALVRTEPTVLAGVSR